MENTELAPLSGRDKLDKKSEELVEKIVYEQDSDKLKDLVGLFNINQSKKNILRADIYSKLLDKISIQMVVDFSIGTMDLEESGMTLF